MNDFGFSNNVIIEVKGTQSAGDMYDSMEIITPGTYNYRNGVCYIMYHEYNEGSKTPVKNMIKITDDKIELVKRGEYNVNMVFGDGKENTSCYKTPFGEIFIGILTRSKQIVFLDDKLTIDIKYRLSMNGEYASDNEIRIIVK